MEDVFKFSCKKIILGNGLGDAHICVCKVNKYNLLTSIIAGLMISDHIKIKRKW